MTYEDKWKDYKRRRLTFLVIFVFYVPGAFFIGFQLQKLFGSGVSFYVVAIIWMIALAISGLRLTYWRCPRCGKFFFAKWVGVNQFARKCVHCGLPKWAAKDENEFCKDIQGTLLKIVTLYL
jgi:hypothetical protein